MLITGVLGIGVVSGCGGYMSLDHFVLWFIEVPCGVGGVGWANIVDIYYLGC